MISNVKQLISLLLFCAIRVLTGQGRTAAARMARAFAAWRTDSGGAGGRSQQARIRAEPGRLQRWRAGQGQPRQGAGDASQHARRQPHAAADDDGVEVHAHVQAGDGFGHAQGCLVEDGGRARFRGGQAEPGTPRYDVGLQSKQDALQRLVDVWATGEASAALGFEAARLFDQVDPMEKEKNRLLAERRLTGRAAFKALAKIQQDAIAYLEMARQPESGRDAARFAELGDLWEGLYASAPASLATAIEWYERDAAAGEGEMPYPPEYPKMPGEPPRVQPSKKARPDDEYDSPPVE